MGKIKNFLLKYRIPMGIAAIIAAFTVVFQNFTVTAPALQVELEMKAVPVTVCGQKFQQLIVDEKPGVEVAYSPVRIGAVEALLPDHVLSPQSTQVTIKNSTTSPYNADIPILPSLPTGDFRGIGAPSPSICERVALYLRHYREKPVTAYTALVKFNLSKGKGALVPSSTKVNAKIAPVKPEKVLNVDGSQSMMMKAPGYQKPIKYLIITQDLYRYEADQLASFRNSRGISTKVISVSELPGYHANDRTPPQCEAPFDQECYHYWGDPIENVSQLAVPSLMGFHRETNFAEKYTRVSYIPGLIRAYLRQIKASNPLKAVLLIGDPEQVPPIFTPKVDFSHGTQNAGCSNFNWVHENYANDDYCSGSARFSLGTDLYYTFPSIQLTDNHQVNMSEVYPGMLTCEYFDSQNKPHRELKVWCEQNEHRYWGENSGPMKAYAWVVQAPFTRIFSDPASNGIVASAFSSIPLSDYLAVGRLLTQTRYRARGKDPAVQNYVNKLIYWETHLPSFANRSVATFGGNQTWLWSGDATPFFNTYGTGSRIYASSTYFPALPNSSSLCNSTNCVYDNNDNILNGFAASTHTAWLLDGHGGHSGVQGTENPNYPNLASGFGFSHSFNGDGADHLVHATSASTSAIDLLMGSSNRLIGHIFANSCDVSSYYVLNYSLELLRALDPLTEPASMAENFIGMNGAGAINTYLNYFVGWSYSDNQYNHQLINRVFLGDPFATIAAPLQTPNPKAENL